MEQKYGQLKTVVIQILLNKELKDNSAGLRHEYLNKRVNARKVKNQITEKSLLKMYQPSVRALIIFNILKLEFVLLNAL